MARLKLVLLITFIESFATIFMERGVFFYTTERLGFSGAQNLWLALVFGSFYVIGGLTSHNLAARIGERRMLIATIAVQAIAHLTLLAAPLATVIFVCKGTLGLMNGLKWPVVESYVGAGRAGKDSARAVGWFNISWSSAVPLSLGVAGPIIAFWSGGLFLAPAAINLAALVMVLFLPARPAHMPDDHPHRPAPQVRIRIQGLLASSRWLLLMAYASLWIWAALSPNVLDRLGVPVAYATMVATLVDVFRVIAFVVLRRWHGWHLGIGTSVLGLLAVPAGIAMVVFGPTLAWVIAGEVIFGLSAGAVYYAALYYAMLATNASVDAGGKHEGLIGLGFAIGPACCLVGLAMGPVMGSLVLGTLAGLAPLLLVTGAGGLRPLLTTVRRNPLGDSADQREP